MTLREWTSFPLYSKWVPCDSNSSSLMVARWSSGIRCSSHYAGLHFTTIPQVYCLGRSRQGDGWGHNPGSRFHLVPPTPRHSLIRVRGVQSRKETASVLLLSPQLSKDKKWDGVRPA